MFSRHGIPETVINDNGPQFSSHEFSVLATSYNFTHTTSSPYYLQSNGQAERTVQTVKHLLTKSEDPYLALLIYHTTPLPWCNLSPLQLLMGRHLRTNLPQVQEHLPAKWTYLEEFKQQHANYKQKQKSAYDTRYRVRPLAPIPKDNEVWVTMGQKHQVELTVRQVLSDHMLWTHHRVKFNAIAVICVLCMRTLHQNRTIWSKKPLQYAKAVHNKPLSFTAQ